MKKQSSFREQAKFSQRILHSSWRILRSPMSNEHAAYFRIMGLCYCREHGNGAIMNNLTEQEVLSCFHFYGNLKTERLGVGCNKT